MKPLVFKTVTHGAALGLGLLLAILAGGAVMRGSGAGSAGRPDGPAGSAAAAGSAAPHSGRPRPPVVRPPGTAATIRLSSKEYKAAWDAIGRRDLTQQERIQLQQTVLRQWALVDLEGALKAALKSPWDEHNHIDRLLFAFNEAFAKDPIGSWDLLQSGRLGLGVSLIKSQWAMSVTEEHPSLVMSYFAELPDKPKKELLQMMANQVAADPAKREEFIKKLCEFPENDQFLDWVKTLAPILGASESASTLRDKMASASTPQETTLLLHQFALSLRTADIAAIKGEWDRIPEDLKGRAAKALTLHSDASKNTPELFDLLAKADQWQFMNAEKWRLREYAKGKGKAEELARWALTLPENSGSQEIFHRAVEPYIKADIDKAGDWIESLPRGWQRDRALAELSQQSLWGRGNTELSQWALEEISDPRLKADATKWRGDWERQTGRSQ